MLSGTVTVERQEGSGTAFTLRIPSTYVVRPTDGDDPEDEPRSGGFD